MGHGGDGELAVVPILIGDQVMCLLAASVESGSSLAQLEEIFWACDYVATTRGVDATPVAQCATATRELRRVKFANSFHALLAWWQENKAAEHERVRRSRSEQPL